jgi:MFS family permease
MADISEAGKPLVLTIGTAPSIPSEADVQAAPATDASDAPRPGLARVGTFEAFSFANYRLLWTGNFLSTVAMWIQTTTMGWVVYSLTGSGAVLGSINLVRAVPAVAVTPLAGVTLDRFHRNTIIAVSQLTLFAFTFLLAWDVLLGTLQVWHLFIFTLLVAVANAFNMPARQTFVFDLVPEHVVPNAIAMDNLAFSSGRTISSACAGVLIAAFGAAANFFIQSFVYIAIMATVLSIKTTRRPRPVGRRNVFREMAEGYGYASRNPQVRLLLLLAMIAPVFLFSLHLTLLPIFAATVFPGGAATLGLMLGALGVGGLFGGVLTAWLSGRVDRRGLLQLIALILHGLLHAAFCVVALLSHQLWLALPFLLLAGAIEPLHLTTNQTVLQLLAPDHLRGRVTSVLQLAQIINPLGGFAAGILADRLGAPTVGIIFSMIAAGLAALILACSSRMRTLRLSQLRELGREGLAH